MAESSAYPFREPNLNLLGIAEPIEDLSRVDTMVQPPRLRALLETGPAKPASSEMLIARLAAARVEEADGHHAMAGFRLAGDYDGDEPSRIALATIAVLQEHGLLREDL